MKQFLCSVVENRILWANVHLLTLDAPEQSLLVHPGQCMQVRNPTTQDPYLRSTGWFYDTGREQIALTLSSGDPVGEQAHTGAVLDLLGPVGLSIRFDSTARHILLVGQGSQTIPLVAIGREAVEQGRSVLMVAHPSPGEPIFPPHLLPPEIEYRTEAAGPELFTWADAVVASGSDELYAELGTLIRMARYRLEHGFARVFVQRALPCGTGACYACAVDTTRGVRLACTDGPAFDLAELANKRAP